MSEETRDSAARMDQSGAEGPMPGVIAGNLGTPIRLSNVELDGFAAEAARPGETIKIWTRLSITSDEPSFHKMAGGLARAIQHYSALAGTPIDLQRAATVLLVIKRDKSAELWVDTAAVAIKVMAKRDFEAGSPVLESDIVDIAEMAFPCVRFEKEDKVVVLFRQDWRFGLFFDFNSRRDFSKTDMNRSLGALLRNLKYRHIFDTIDNQDVLARLTETGWFPFAEIITSEFPAIAQACEAGFDLTDIEASVLASFDRPRLDRMLKRWLSRPALASREPVLRSAVRSFVADDPVAVMKTVLTEREGVLREAYQAIHGTGAKLDALLEFAVASAERKAGSPTSLLLPASFAKYLRERPFAHFDPTVGLGHASSRHAVGHGMAAPATYTKVGALQVLLTLDQLAFSL